MSKKICSNCRSAIQDFPEMFCLARKLRTEDGLFDNCFYFDPKSVFDRVTASPEALAPKLVYQTADDFGDVTWSSTIIPGWYVGREDCIAATVEKLKEVYNG